MKNSLLLIVVLMGIPSFIQLWENDFHLYTSCFRGINDDVSSCKSVFLFKETERFEKVTGKYE